jgi:ferric iron reductase protein FhuF
VSAVPIDAEPGLAAAARLGPYFAWQPWDDEPGWRPLAELRDADVLAERVETGRQTLMRMSGLGRDEIGEREVASITFLGLASRLLSPLLAAVALDGVLPIPEPERMWWRPVDGGPVPIAYQGLVALEDHPATTLTRTAIRGLVEPILETFRDRFTLSPQVLWGNVSSALGGAAGMIADNAPGHAERAAVVVEQTLALEPLRHSAELVRPDPERARWFLVRRNCCLYYRIPGGGTCGDCVLTPQDVRRRQWQSVLRR